MKVLNLRCSHLHAFEGWFASEDDFQGQLTTGLLTCPFCADAAIQKMPSAPRLNFGADSVESSPSTTSGASANAAPQVSGASGDAASQAEVMKALRHMLANTEDVGERFADEARAMHYGDAKQRSIRGQASRAEAVELIEEGIEVMSLPLPAAVKETLQ